MYSDYRVNTGKEVEKYDRYKHFRSICENLSDDGHKTIGKEENVDQNENTQSVL
jgi:hypothetical protein